MMHTGPEAMKYSDEQLSAFLDGELSDVEFQKLEACLVNDSKLRQRLSDLAEANTALQAAYRPIADEPVPAHILAMLDAPKPVSKNAENSNDVIELFSVNDNQRGSKWLLPIAASIALVAGVIIGQFGLGGAGSNQTLMAQVSGTIAPDNPLFDVLETTPSAMQAALIAGETIEVRPTLSYQTASGTYCREFEVTGTDTALHSVACRSDAGWEIQILNRIQVHGQEGMRTASGASDQAVDQFVSDTMDDIPFGSEQELVLIKNGWKP
jgi:hypothetical protein